MSTSDVDSPDDIIPDAAALLVDLLELLRSATQTASVFSGERTEMMAGDISSPTMNHRY
jgi:hypothetical protein